MRQRRQRLQVSTFPFLAVLLCAMGSLILLLLVIDRRAKAVARAKAMRTLAQAAADEEKAASAHRAEWERCRQMLHEQLLGQDQEILGQLQAVQGDAATAAGSVETELARGRQLQEQLQAEHSTLARWQEELTARRAESANAAEQAGASQAERARLSADLERMERTLADLKLARQRQQQMYSVVPYRGKHGDNRKPLYIECTGAELIFHPDRLALRGPAATPLEIRAEIDRRLARQRSATNPLDGKQAENAYLLMLIRPNGITTYYRTLAALKGLKIDFGYELVAQDWILDFSEEDNAPGKQPWMVAEGMKEKQPAGTSPLNRSSRPSAPPALVRDEGLNWAASGSAKPADHPARRGGIVVSQEGQGGAASPDQGLAGVPSTPVQHIGGIRGGAVGNSVSAGGDPSGPSLADGLMNGGHPSASRQTVPDGKVVTARPQPSGQVEPSSSAGVPGEAGNIGQLFGKSDPGTPEQSSGRVAAGGVFGSPGPPFEGAATTTGASEDSSSGHAAGPALSTVGGAGQTGGTPTDTSIPNIAAPASVLPPLVSTRAKAATGASVDAPQVPATEGAERGSPAPTQGNSGEPMRGAAGNPLDRLAAQSPAKKPVGAVPLRPGILIGNRDWIIPIECTADALLLQRSGQPIATVELAKGSGSNPLLATVQQMITRRQATVRPGEPPYRPMIRFRVWPDGLRSYYLAYPALEALHVPMSRENLDPEEVKPASGGR